MSVDAWKTRVPGDDAPISDHHRAPEPPPLRCRCGSEAVRVTTPDRAYCDPCWRGGIGCASQKRGAA